MEIETYYTLTNVKALYMNRAGRMMENYFSDLIVDLDIIDGMTKGDVYFFIVRPKGTHPAIPDSYDSVRDAIAQVFGNYVVFRIEMLDTDKYIFKNWDILKTKSYDTKSQELIQKYENFTLG